MSLRAAVDVTFDFRTDTPPGRDPDTHSPRLRMHHQQLWSKPLPTGGAFELVTTTPGVYLHHRSGRGEFFLSSDSVIPTFIGHTRLRDLLARIPPDDLEAFNRISYTMGGMMVFPSNQVLRQPTINGARGMNARIKDRFDLTVECIRRHYRGEDSPLASALARYSAFFELFGDFVGYVDFFLLQDVVTSDYAATECFLPFTGFDDNPVPTSVEAYQLYRKGAEAFVQARNRRILEATAVE